MFLEEEEPVMPTRELLSPAQRAQMLRLPDDLSDQLLARYYTFSDDDLALIKQRRRNQNRLGFTVQLAYMRFPGRTWTASAHGLRNEMRSWKKQTNDEETDRASGYLC